MWKALPTSPLPVSQGSVVTDAHHLGGAPGRGALARLPHHIGEGELHVLLSRLQPKELGIEEHEGVEQHKR